MLLSHDYLPLADYSSALVTMATVAFLAKMQVPCTDHRWTAFNRMRWRLVGAYVALAMSNVASALWPTDVDSLIMRVALLFVAMVQALLFTAMCLTFINPQKASMRWLASGGAVVASAVAATLVVGRSMGKEAFTVAVYASTAVYIAELVTFSRRFFRTYTESSRYIEGNYEEDLSSRLRWIKWCFISALGVGVAALCVVVMPVGSAGMCAFTVCYTLYYVYLGVHIVNYRISSAFIVKVLPSGEKKESIAEKPTVCAESPRPVEAKAEAMRIALKKWADARRYVENEQTVEEIAAELGFSRTFLAWYFTSQLGTTFRAWRTELRIKEAMRLINEEGAAVAALHLQVGISDKSNFYKHFKAYTGITPTEYSKKATNS